MRRMYNGRVSKIRLYSDRHWRWEIQSLRYRSDKTLPGVFITWPSDLSDQRIDVQDSLQSNTSLLPPMGIPAAQQLPHNRNRNPARNNNRRRHSHLSSKRQCRVGKVKGMHVIDSARVCSSDCKGLHGGKRNKTINQSNRRRLTEPLLDSRTGFLQLCGARRETELSEGNADGSLSGARGIIDRRWSWMLLEAKHIDLTFVIPLIHHPHRNLRRLLEPVEVHSKIKQQTRWRTRGRCGRICRRTCNARSSRARSTSARHTCNGEDDQ